MRKNSKLLEMLTGYAAAHQHPFNVMVHLVGIPVIMLGVLIPLSWITIEIENLSFTPAHLLVVGFFVYYATLDIVFALVFLIAGLALSGFAGVLAELPFKTALAVAGACFFGGYLAQFLGHAVEKSMPVLVRHPVQANLAAPFFTVVEIFKLLGLRESLFDEVQREIGRRRQASSGSTSSSQ